jgi:uncharacterized Zn finger protein
VKESLTCSQCSKTWKREVSRGRKPVLCPACLKKNVKEKEKQAKQKEVVVSKNDRKVTAVPKEAVQTVVVTENSEDKIKLTTADILREYYPLPSNSDELLKSTKNGSTWGCTKCGATLKVNIAVTAIPTHRCPRKSTNIRPYERID